MSALSEQPGLYFVVATILPMVSFLLLILTAFLRHAARACDSPLCNTLYRVLGGGRPGRTAAYVATTAIALSFVCSLVGAIHFASHGQDHHRIEELKEEAHHLESEFAHRPVEEHPKIEKELQTVNAEIHRLESKWVGRIEWANPAGPYGTKKDARASILYVGYRIDNLTVVMFLMVTLIATLIHIFSIGYMSEELAEEVEDHQVHTADGHLKRRGRFGRFFLFLSLFCFSMLNLVLADNLFQVFVSWELVGICSYLLIGFNYERQSASNAANKAFITNRVGDAGFVIGLLIIWTYIGTFNFEEIFKTIRAPLTDSHGVRPLRTKIDGEYVPLGARIVRANLVVEDGEKKLVPSQTGDQAVLFSPKVHLHVEDADPGDETDESKWYLKSFYPDFDSTDSMPYWLLVAAGLGIFVGCVGKSAQFPLHVWLPDAMEGPTPVSALIHAATMVAAGVYLVARAFPLFTAEALIVIAYVGGITLFVAATIAIVQTDIKKVLAYSTVSQLGYMMLALGVGGWVAGIFHLITHAFFKALLFLCSGSVIFGCHHEQEMTKMGGLFPKMKITALTMLVGVLTIAGTPLFSGWYSKDMIVAQSLGYVRLHPEHFLLFLLPVVTAGITTFYMFRMWLMTFTGKPRDKHVFEHAKESPATMTIPLIVLAVFSICVAWGWPLHDPEASHLNKVIHHGQPHHVLADFGGLAELGELEHAPGLVFKHVERSERYWALKLHGLAELSAFVAAGIGVIFAFLLYYQSRQTGKTRLDPEEAREQFPGVYALFANKWYFDELYSALLVRPALRVSQWCKAFDLRGIDGVINGSGRCTVTLSRWSGWVDRYIVDGLVNLIASVSYGVGSWLRRVQTGYIRSYVLFLVLAAIGVFAILSYFLAMAAAG
ncbi:MAG: hypothetical protein KatS3mg105_0327 [Gemmatales bacterium]|nr:MAG: hypothetical protein KatS3mg105_0327 [Gemmatales bacterium]